MWRERLSRIALVILALVLTLGLVKAYADQRQKTSGAINPLGSQVKEKIEDFGEDVLGSVVEHLPAAPNLKKVSQGEKEAASGAESEPITEPVENIQNQTQQLIEIIKKLPEDQLEAIKEQLYREVCESWLQEKVEE